MSVNMYVCICHCHCHRDTLPVKDAGKRERRERTEHMVPERHVMGLKCNRMYTFIHLHICHFGIPWALAHRALQRRTATIMFHLEISPPISLFLIGDAGSWLSMSSPNEFDVLSIQALSCSLGHSRMLGSSNSV